MALDNIIDGEIIEPLTLFELAETANRYHAQVQAAGRNMLEAAWYAGEALNAAQANCKRGGKRDFVQWLKDDFDGGVTNAYAYIKVFSALKISDLDEYPSIRAALKAITRDGDERERKRKKEREQQEQLELSGTTPVDLLHGDFRTVLNNLSDVDAIITDPPYPREYLGLFGDLSTVAARILKPGGICAVMSGQSYLPEVFAHLDTALTYRWTLAYLTPGATMQIWDRNILCRWKPILLFTNGEPEESDWVDDVATSATPDKDHHHWGQSESGMADLIDRLTKPGELICDPFLGGGTTAVVAHQLGRKFIGCDVDQTCIDTTARRFA